MEKKYFLARQWVHLSRQDIWVIDQAFQSRWLDIGQVLFLRVYGLRQSRGP